LSEARLGIGGGLAGIIKLLISCLRYDVLAFAALLQILELQQT
jgi:hypothetical protein